MNMNREAVDAALGLAGNMPLTDEDKTYNNLVYVFCKNLYLSVLFNALCEIDWRCARKETALVETPRNPVRQPGMIYYEMPSDCLRPLSIDGGEVPFRNDTHFIVTEKAGAKLYYVFHKRTLKNFTLTTPSEQETRDNRFVITRPSTPETAAQAGTLYTRNIEPLPESTDDFPEWEYTPYDADFWTYFSYKLAAALVPKLRADGGAAQRAAALEALAAQKGEAAIQRSRGSAESQRAPHRTWAELCGLSTGPSGGWAAGRTPCRGR